MTSAPMSMQNSSSIISHVQNPNTLVVGNLSHGGATSGIGKLQEGERVYSVVLYAQKSCLGGFEGISS